MTTPCSLSKCRNLNELAYFLKEAKHTTLGRHGGRKVLVLGKEYSMNELVHKFTVIRKRGDATPEVQRQLLQKLFQLEKDQSYLVLAPENSKRGKLLKIRRIWGHFFDKLKYGCSFNRHKILKEVLSKDEKKPNEQEKEPPVDHKKPQTQETPVNPPAEPEVKEAPANLSAKTEVKETPESPPVKPEVKETTTPITSQENTTIGTPTAENPKRPSFASFTKSEQEVLNKVCDKVEEELLSRYQGNPAKQINTGYSIGWNGLSNKMCDYLIETGVIHEWNQESDEEKVVVKLRHDDNILYGYSFSSKWRGLTHIETEKRVKQNFKRPAFDRFTKEEQQMLHVACDKIEQALVRRELGAQPFDFSLELQLWASKGISSEMCDFLVEQGVIHAWNYFERGYVVVVKISPSDLRSEGLGYVNPARWKTLKDIQKAQTSV